MTAAQLDAIDQRTIDARAAEYDRIAGPRVGDFIDYADGITRRIAHYWPGDWHDDGIARVQPTDGGSFYLGGSFERHDPRDIPIGSGNEAAYVSYSGSLFPGIPTNTLKLAGSRNGSVWVFHHERWGAGQGVDGVVAFRVYSCTLDGRDPWRGDETVTARLYEKSNG